jgi:hypothetical protein
MVLFSCTVQLAIYIVIQSYRNTIASFPVKSIKLLQKAPVSFGRKRIDNSSSELDSRLFPKF